MYRTEEIIEARNKMLEGLKEMVELGVPADDIIALVSAYAKKKVSEEEE